jgi:DNA polymerase sigma
MPCNVCHTQLPGYVFSGGNDAAQFMCTSCIAVFIKRKNEELVLQKQKDEDQALLCEAIDFPTMMKRAGCRHLDDWIHKLLGQLQLTDDSVRLASEVVRDVDVALSSTGNTVEVYGSRRTGLVISGSDFDFFVKFTAGSEGSGAPAAAASCSTKKRMDAVVQALKCARTPDDPPAPIFSQISAINARVPIVRCVHTVAGASLDLSFSPVGVLGSRFLCAQLGKPEYRAGRPLIVVLKTLLKAWGCDDANNGGLGSFAVAMMVLWFLRQCHERTKKEETEDLSLAVHLMNFFDYFGNKFDAKGQGFDVLEGKIISQRSRYCKSPGGICVRHPIDRDENAANGCDKFFSVIQPAFRNAALAMNHLARMKYLMTSSDIYGEMEQLVFLPVRQLFTGKKSGGAPLLRPQNNWLDSHLYCGGFGA